MCDFTDSTNGNTCFYWFWIVHFIFVCGGHPSKQKSVRFLLAQILPGGELPSNPQGEGFFGIHVSAITRGARTDPQISKGVNTLPSQSVTWNGKSQMHSFWSQRVFGGSHFSSVGKIAKRIWKQWKFSHNLWQKIGILFTEFADFRMHSKCWKHFWHSVHWIPSAEKIFGILFTEFADFRMDRFRIPGADLQNGPRDSNLKKLE